MGNGFVWSTFKPHLIAWKQPMGTIMDRRKLHAFNRIWTCSYLCVAAEAQFNETVTVKMQLNWTHSLNDHCQWTMDKEAALQLQLTELYNEDRTLSLYNYCSSSHRIIHVWLNDLNAHAFTSWILFDANYIRFRNRRDLFYSSNFTYERKWTGKETDRSPWTVSISVGHGFFSKEKHRTRVWNASENVLPQNSYISRPIIGTIVLRHF